MIDFFSIPTYLAISIYDAFVVLLDMIFYIVHGFFYDGIRLSPIGLFFLISVAISFIFVAIKFIRTIVWGS